MNEKSSGGPPVMQRTEPRLSNPHCPSPFRSRRNPGFSLHASSQSIPDSGTPKKMRHFLGQPPQVNEGWCPEPKPTRWSLPSFLYVAWAYVSFPAKWRWVVTVYLRCDCFRQRRMLLVGAWGHLNRCSKAEKNGRSRLKMAEGSIVPGKKEAGPPIPKPDHANQSDCNRRHT